MGVYDDAIGWWVEVFCESACQQLVFASVCSKPGAALQGALP